tara:strand:+ start:233 stop:493 length:261 start_codon:yes stop_codon:yes gene_type:complete
MAAMNPVNLSVEQLASLGAFTPQHAITQEQQSLLVTWKQIEEDGLPDERQVLDVYYDPRTGLVMIEMWLAAQQETVVVPAADEPPF